MKKNTLNINSQFDLQFQLRKIATEQTLEYIQKKMENCLCFPHTINILFNYSLPKIHENGLILEFGVRKGLTIKEIAKKINKRICHGFDSFEGLPEDWSGQQYPKGAYSEKGKRPKVPKNVVLHQGWFKDTLPKFLQNNKEKIDFVHFDCDLFSSTKLILDLIGNRFQKGTILIFDEYFNYPNWKNHEFKAFKQFTKKENVLYEYLAFTSKSAVCLRIK